MARLLHVPSQPARLCSISIVRLDKHQRMPDLHIMTGQSREPPPDLGARQHFSPKAPFESQETTGRFGICVM